jgi:hypothetical protein
VGLIVSCRKMVAFGHNRVEVFATGDFADSCVTRILVTAGPEGPDLDKVSTLSAFAENQVTVTRNGQFVRYIRKLTGREERSIIV